MLLSIIVVNRLSNCRAASRKASGDFCAASFFNPARLDGSA
jgi:hypothetical protein